MKRYFGIGAIAGVIVGLIIQNFIPQILSFELLYNILSRKQTGIPLYPTASGSVFAVGTLFPIFTCVLGGLISATVFKLTPKRKRTERN